MHIGKLAGSLVGGATLDDVEWRDASGAVALRAEHVSARWSAAKAIAKRPAIELRVERPFVDVERLAADFDVEELARAVAHDAERVDAISVPRFEMVDATVRVGALTMSGVDASGALAWDRAAGRVALDGVAVRAAASSATVRGNLSRDAVDVRVTALRIAPDDLRRLSPRAEAPRTPLVGELRLHGRSDGAMLLGELRPDHGRILVAGNIDFYAAVAHSSVPRSTTPRPTTHRRCSPARCASMQRFRRRRAAADLARRRPLLPPRARSQRAVADGARARLRRGSPRRPLRG